MKKFMEKFSNPYAGVWEMLTLYWKAYGGWSTFFRSSYLHISIVLAIVVCFFHPEGKDWTWDETVITVIPNILGFSLGGYAMLIGFSDKKFLDFLKEDDPGEDSSLYMEVNAAFVHFIIVQSVALLYAIVISYLDCADVFPFIGVTISFYAVATMVSATLAVLRFASWYDQYPPSE